LKTKWPFVYHQAQLRIRNDKLHGPDLGRTSLPADSYNSKKEPEISGKKRHFSGKKRIIVIGLKMIDRDKDNKKLPEFCNTK
jgi:hypothetical protein